MHMTYIPVSTSKSNASLVKEILVFESFSAIVLAKVVQQWLTRHKHFSYSVGVKSEKSAIWGKFFWNFSYEVAGLRSLRSEENISKALII